MSFNARSAVSALAISLSVVCLFACTTESETSVMPAHGPHGGTRLKFWRTHLIRLNSRWMRRLGRSSSTFVKIPLGLSEQFRSNRSMPHLRPAAKLFIRRYTRIRGIVIRLGRLRGFQLVLTICRNS